MQEISKKLRQYSWQELIISFLLVILFVSLVIYRYKYNLPSMPDFFRAYYLSGKLIIENPSTLYDLSDTVVYGFVNLPILAYLFTPFSYLNEEQAGVLFTLLGILAIIPIAIILTNFSQLKSWKRLLFLGVILLNIPISNSIWLGNTTHFVFLALISSFFCLKVRKEVLSGILLAIAGVIKLPLLFLILFFIIKKRWQALFGACLTLLGIVISSIALCGLNLNIIWLQRCIFAFSGKVVGAYNVQSIDSFLLRLLTTISLDSWDMYEASWQLKFIRYSLFLLLIGGTFWVLVKAKYSTTPEAESIEFSIFLCLAIISSPVSWTHYYLLLLLPISVLISLEWMVLEKWAWSTVIAVVILLVSTPPVKSVSFENPLAASFTRNFLVSHYFWGAVLLLVILLMARWRYGNSPKILNIT